MRRRLARRRSGGGGGVVIPPGELALSLEGNPSFNATWTANGGANDLADPVLNDLYAKCVRYLVRSREGDSRMRERILQTFSTGSMHSMGRGPSAGQVYLMFDLKRLTGDLRINDEFVRYIEEMNKWRRSRYVSNVMHQRTSDNRWVYTYGKNTVDGATGTYHPNDPDPFTGRLASTQWRRTNGFQRFVTYSSGDSSSNSPSRQHGVDSQINSNVLCNVMYALMVYMLWVDRGKVSPTFGANKYRQVADDGFWYLKTQWEGLLNARHQRPLGNIPFWDDGRTAAGVPRIDSSSDLNDYHNWIALLSYYIYMGRMVEDMSARNVITAAQRGGETPAQQRAKYEESANFYRSTIARNMQSVNIPLRAGVATTYPIIFHDHSMRSQLNNSPSYYPYSSQATAYLDQDFWYAHNARLEGYDVSDEANWPAKWTRGMTRIWFDWDKTEMFPIARNQIAGEAPTDATLSQKPWLQAPYGGLDSMPNNYWGQYAQNRNQTVYPQYYVNIPLYHTPFSNSPNWSRLWSIEHVPNSEQWRDRYALEGIHNGTVLIGMAAFVDRTGQTLVSKRYASPVNDRAILEEWLDYIWDTAMGVSGEFQSQKGTGPNTGAWRSTRLEHMSPADTRYPSIVVARMILRARDLGLYP